MFQHRPGRLLNLSLRGPACLLPLSDRELKLIAFMHAHPGEVLTRDQLLNAVWGINYFGNTRTLDQHVAQLRKKLGSAVIETVHGIGYRHPTKNQPP